MTGRGHRGWHGSRGSGRSGGWQQADLPSADDARRLADRPAAGGWFEGEPR